jgi:type I restriction enzyme S subunit
MVPSGWSRKPVSQLFEVQLGKMLNAKAKMGSEQFPYLTNFNVQWGYFDLSKLNKMHFSKKERLKFALRKGDILVCEGGEVGRCAIWNDEFSNCYYQKALHRLRPINDEISTSYFYEYMRLISGTKIIENLTSKTSIAHLTREKLLNLMILVPPKAELDKITQILSAWNKAIETTEKLIENSKAQKKALMQQLFSDTDSNAGSKAKTAPFQIGELTSIYDGTHSTPHYVKEGVPFYSVEHLTRDDFSDTKFISEAVYQKENLRVKLEKGDILMTRIGDIGTPKYLDWDVQASFYVSLALIKQSTAFNSHYLSYYIQSDAFQRELWKKTIHVAFPKKINLGDLGKCIVFLPPIEEQKQIAKILSSVDQAIKAQEQKLGCLQKEKHSLMQRLLTGKRRVKVSNTKSTKAVA